MPRLICVALAGVKARRGRRRIALCSVRGESTHADRVANQRFAPRARIVNGPNVGQYRLAGVMGWPIVHSRSPLIHNHWFGELGLAGSYVPLAVPPEKLERALRALPVLGFAGVNVTIPLKTAAYGIVDRLDSAAQAIGAVNTVAVGAGGQLDGRNTDAFGFLASIEEVCPGFDFARGPAVVIGAGGAARAIVHGLREAGTPRVRVVNRTQARSAVLGQDFGSDIDVFHWQERADILDGAALVVQTTSLGMEGQAPLDLSLDALPRDALVCDIVYTPKRTALLTAAAARGNPVVEGLGMLLHQARLAFQVWFGVLPDVTPALREKLAASVAA